MKKRLTRVLISIAVCALLIVSLIDPPPESLPVNLPPNITARSQSSKPPPVSESEAASSVTSSFTPEEIELPLPRVLEPEEVVLAYFERLHKAYINTDDATDVFELMEMNQRHNQIFERWIRNLNQRRRLILEHGLTYVETRELPYILTFLEEEELDDDRVAQWISAGANGVGVEDENERLLHFVISGEVGEAYPPFMALNAQHTMRLRFDGENWRVVWHYYPGAIRTFRQPGMTIDLLSDDEMEILLFEEFADPVALPEASGNYNGEAAAGYAWLYTEEANPEFYQIDDWMGNCMNFISQCVWAGMHGGDEISSPELGGHMSSDWYAGGGGGSPEWENVEYFWGFAVEGFASLLPENVNSLVQGDIIQTRSMGHPDDEGESAFDHSLVVVERDRLLLAQNSPAAFVYYSDLVNTEFRFLHPVQG